MSTVKARFNVTAGRPYESNGEQKKHWINVGRATQWDDGNISIELHAVPVGNWFDGKLMLFPQDENKQQESQSRQRPSRGNSSQSDEIPF